MASIQKKGKGKEIALRKQNHFLGVSGALRKTWLVASVLGLYRVFEGLVHGFSGPKSFRLKVFSRPEKHHKCICESHS